MPAIHPRGEFAVEKDDEIAGGEDQGFAVVLHGGLPSIALTFLSRIFIPEICRLRIGDLESLQ